MSRLRVPANAKWGHVKRSFSQRRGRSVRYCDLTMSSVEPYKNTSSNRKTSNVDVCNDLDTPLEWVKTKSPKSFLYTIHISKFKLVQNQFCSRWAFTLQNLNRFSELTGIKVIHFCEGVSNWFSFELASVDAMWFSTNFDLINATWWLVRPAIIAPGRVLSIIRPN